jgi:hypothetical protein
MANRSVAMGLALAFVAMTALCCAPGAAELPRLDHPARSDGSLKLLVVGDWGRKGTHNQSRVADQVTAAPSYTFLVPNFRLLQVSAYFKHLGLQRRYCSSK